MKIVKTRKTSGASKTTQVKMPGKHKGSGNPGVSGRHAVVNQRKGK